MVSFQNRTCVPPWRNQPGWNAWGRISVQLKASFLLFPLKENWSMILLNSPVPTCVHLAASSLALHWEATQQNRRSIHFSTFSFPGKEELPCDSGALAREARQRSTTTAVPSKIHTHPEIEILADVSIFATGSDRLFLLINNIHEKIT